MCGIFLTLCWSGGCENCQDVKKSSQTLIQNRGPDHVGGGYLDLEGDLALQYLSSVLWLQGSSMQTQPVVDQKGNILMWNGDVFGGHERIPDMSDTSFLAKHLGECSTDEDILNVFDQIKGPFAFVYISRDPLTLWYGRDFFGRQSLLISSSKECLSLTSCTVRQEDKFQEVPALGIFRLDLSSPLKSLQLHPWILYAKSTSLDNDILSSCTISSPLRHCPIKLEEFNNTFEPIVDLQDKDFCDIFNSLLEDPEISEYVDNLILHLRQAVRTRISHQPGLCKDCIISRSAKCDHCVVAVLFSGGLDSAVLARLAADELPSGQILDLVNVAFQLGDGGFAVPDRLTGLQAYEELKMTNPDRSLNFVCVDVTKEELVTMRTEHVTNLLYPLNTVLDDSIGCALWFAARARGTIGNESYSSPARILLLGMGIDEQLGGYSRHRGRFSKEGAEGLIDELKMELLRISERNLGRDNRIVSDHGVAGRFPFLDEDFVNFLIGLPLHIKCDLRLERGLGEKLVLRLAAHRLGLFRTAREPKRAVQFGSRIARMENRKEKGHQKAVRD